MDSNSSVDVALKNDSIEAHKKRKGKVETIGKVAVEDSRDLSMYYTPGVAYVCLEINRDKELSYEYTNRANSIAIVTDGTRILGLGNIGPEAGMPVMEGKALLLKKFGGVDATPIAVASTDEQEIIKFIRMIAPTYGAINLEDLETPKAINVLKALEADLPIPIFHDDSYGTGIVAYAGVKNALKLVGKKLGHVKIVINGAGSAGYGISKLLYFAGARHIITCDREGAIYKGRGSHMNTVKEEIADYTNKDMLKGSLAELAKGADVLIGVSSKGEFTSEIIKSMAEKPIVFALANPDPEINYDDARSAGAEIVATGVSGVPNQVNNMVAFPGVFRGLLDTRSSRMSMEMMVVAGDAIAKTVKKSQLSRDYIVPDFNDKKMAIKATANVAEAVADAAVKTGVARVQIDPAEVKANFLAMVKRYNKIEKYVSRLD